MRPCKPASSCKPSKPDTNGTRADRTPASASTCGRPSSTRPRRWPPEAVLRQQLGGRFHDLSEAVAAVARSTVRASSVVENLNSRLRSYFFLRRHLGADYLHLLQFFLNHRRFLRSDHPERVDRSPTELLTGQEHAHWLELLGLPDPLRN